MNGSRPTGQTQRLLLTPPTLALNHDRGLAGHVRARLPEVTRTSTLVATELPALRARLSAVLDLLQTDTFVARPYTPVRATREAPPTLAATGYV